jgi:adenine-specific DNA-methyltransferase
MFLNYEGKKAVDDIFNALEDIELKFVSGSREAKSMLIKGENLTVMKYLLSKPKLREKVDLVYIDPPFGTSNTFRMSDDKANAISRSNTDELAYNDSLIDEEYLEFLRERLLFLRELLSEKGSIYLHIDYKIGHYVKILMDEVFGRHHFVNDLTRIKCNPKNFEKRGFGNIKDMILFYSKTDDYIWHPPSVGFSEEDLSRLFKKVDKDGRKYTTIPLHAPGETKNGPTGQEWKGMLPPKGRHWRVSPLMLDELDRDGLIEWSKNGVPRKKIFANEKKRTGKKLQDILDFKDPQYPIYPTEKNLDLLKLIVNTSSDPNSLILDCFAGSGTTLIAARDLGRNWIGIDSSPKAIEVVLKRLNAPQKQITDNGYAYFEQVKETKNSNFNDRTLKQVVWPPK